MMMMMMAKYWITAEVRRMLGANDPASFVCPHWWNKYVCYHISTLSMKRASHLESVREEWRCEEDADLNCL